MSKQDYHKEIVREFTAACLKEGFDVYLAKSETHGFYTDETGERAVSFQVALSGGIDLSGNYAASRESGTGWRLLDIPNYSKQNLKAWLYTRAPGWANKNPKYTGRDAQLKMYGKSSGYMKLEG